MRRRQLQLHWRQLQVSKTTTLLTTQASPPAKIPTSTANILPTATTAATATTTRTSSQHTTPTLPFPSIRASCPPRLRLALATRSRQPYSQHEHIQQRFDPGGSNFLNPLGGVRRVAVLALEQSKCVQRECLRCNCHPIPVLSLLPCYTLAPSQHGQ